MSKIELLCRLCYKPSVIRVVVQEWTGTGWRKRPLPPNYSQYRCLSCGHRFNEPPKLGRRTPESPKEGVGSDPVTEETIDG